jgi:N-acetylglucosamine-6-phosphate deacetylase
MGMPRPAPGKMQAALEAAERMREHDVDPHHLAAALLYLREQCEALEALYRVTDRYLRFGLPEHELSEMRLLVGRLRERAQAADDADDADIEHTLPL